MRKTKPRADEAALRRRVRAVSDIGLSRVLRGHLVALAMLLEDFAGAVGAQDRDETADKIAIQLQATRRSVREVVGRFS